MSAGGLWLARGEPARARECADESLETATRTQSRKYVAAAWRLKGEAEIARRQWDEAERWLRDALGMAQAIGNPRQLWKTQAALGRFYDERRNPEAARRAYQAEGPRRVFGIASCVPVLKALRPFGRCTS